MAGKSGIVFGGVDLLDASPALQILDIQIGDVDRDATELPTPAYDGELFGRMRNGVRPIKVTFDLCLPDRIQRVEAIRRLDALLSSRATQVLRVPDRPGEYINAVCTKLPFASARDWSEDLDIEFLAYDPYWYSDDPLFSVALAAGGSVSFFVPCSGSIRPVLTQVITSALTDPTWACSNGQMIMLQGSVVTGTLVIDCEGRWITHTADSAIMSKLSLDSLFFELEPNPVEALTPYIITCINGAAGAIVGKHRWL